MVFPEHSTPHVKQPLVLNANDLGNLKRPDPLAPGSRMADRANAVRIMKKSVGDTALILGWIDLPFTEACSLCGATNFLLLLYDDPELAHRILDFLTPITIDFALAQLELGADMIGAGDAVTSLISPAAYREFALAREQEVFAAIRAKGGLSKLHVCGNTNALLPQMATAGADLFNIDHMVNFEEAARTYSAVGAAFKGNIDPVSGIMRAQPETIRAEVRDLIRRANGRRYIVSAGCEIPAATSDEAMAAFRDY